MLLLKKHLIALVRAGNKNQTIRVWSRPIVRAGQISYTPGLGKMLILGIDELSGFDVLTDLDAQADGFTDRTTLLAELKNIYGSRLPAGKQCYRIRFQWPADKVGIASPAPINPRRSKTPAKVSAPRRKSNSMTPTQRLKLKAFLLAPSVGAAPRPKA